MKRITTILSLMIVLLIAIHPIVAFHYCSGSLASMELFADESQSCCCPSDSVSNLAHGNNISENGCCSNISIEISTDDFLRVDQASSSKLFAVYFVCSPVLEFQYLKDSSRKKSLISHSPPEHLFETGREILSRYCVYII